MCYLASATWRATWLRPLRLLGRGALRGGDHLPVDLADVRQLLQDTDAALRLVQALVDGVPHQKDVPATTGDANLTQARIGIGANLTDAQRHREGDGLTQGG